MAHVSEEDTKRFWEAACALRNASGDQQEKAILHLLQLAATGALPLRDKARDLLRPFGWTDEDADDYNMEYNMPVT